MEALRFPLGSTLGLSGSPRVSFWSIQATWGNQRKLRYSYENRALRDLGTLCLCTNSVKRPRWHSNRESAYAFLNILELPGRVQRGMGLAKVGTGLDKVGMGLAKVPPPPFPPYPASQVPAPPLQS